MPAYTVSYKRQELVSKYSSTVRDLLDEKIPGSCTQAQFKSDVMKPLKFEELMDRQVENLSGGELQRVKLCVCLGKVGLHIFPLCSSFHRHIRINTLRHHKQIMCFHVVEFVKKWVDETSQCWGLASAIFQIPETDSYLFASIMSCTHQFFCVHTLFRMFRTRNCLFVSLEQDYQLYYYFGF
jgi:hypothetical protein